MDQREQRTGVSHNILNLNGEALNGMVIGALLVMGGAAFLLPSHQPSIAQTSKYVTVPVVKGDLSVKVHATGTVEPVQLFEVSSEMSGILKRVLVKPNDQVRAGQTLAELEPTAALAQVARMQAMVTAARARLKEARAGVKRSTAELQRKRSLRSNRLARASDLDTAEYESASTTAKLEALSAEVAVAEADLRAAENNHAKTRIVAPVDGVVLRRNAEPGQTIAASLQPPVLFRIALDLDQMQIRVDVDEADAMRVAAGQTAVFRVPALRGKVLEATVERFHLGPEIVQGVVTYKAVLTFDNRRLNLKPGMTATADILITHERDRLMVPNAALRFLPSRSAPNEFAPPPTLIERLLGVEPAIGAQAFHPGGQSGGAAGEAARVFVMGRRGLQEVGIAPGASDGQNTVVLSGSLREGQQVVTDYADPPG